MRSRHRCSSLSSHWYQPRYCVTHVHECPCDIACAAWIANSKPYPAGYLDTKAEQMPCRETGPYRKTIACAGSPDTFSRNVGIHGSAKRPSLERIPFSLDSWATSIPYGRVKIAHCRNSNRLRQKAPVSAIKSYSFGLSRKV